MVGEYLSEELVYSLSLHSVLRRKAASQSDKPADKKEEESQNVSGTPPHTVEFAVVKNVSQTSWCKKALFSIPLCICRLQPRFFSAASSPSAQNEVFNLKMKFSISKRSFQSAVK